MEGTWVKRPQSSSSPTIIFVHGILSDSETCWRHANGVSWPDLLAKDKAIEQAGIYVFQYKTGIFSGTYRIGNVADALRTHMRVDGVDSRKLVFVCHSMGGIVARRYLVQNKLELIDSKKEIGLFLIASPSLGSEYANWLVPIARFLNHTQADALRFDQANTWLLDLDEDFFTLKESGRLPLRGMELIEDKFIVLPQFFGRQVVEPFAGARYFPNYKVPDSDHFSICKVEDSKQIQYRLLIEFIQGIMESPPTAVTQAEAVPTEPAIAEPFASPSNVSKLRFSGPIEADLVSCQLAIHQIDNPECTLEVAWPKPTLGYIETLRKLQIEAANHLEPTSIFHGGEPKSVAAFISSARYTLQSSDQIISGAGVRASKLILGMLPYWGHVLDNIIARSLTNFLTLCNFQIIRDVTYLLSGPQLRERYFPKEYLSWFSSGDSNDALRDIFPLEGDLCSAKLSILSGHRLEGVYFWGPREDVLFYVRWRPGEPIRGTWFDKYLIPQNELRLLRNASTEIFRYDEKLELIKVLDSEGNEIG